MKLQITLFHNQNKYRPVATVIEIPNIEDFNNNKSEYVKKAISKIATKRYKTPTELYNEGYTKYKYRPYKDEDKKAMFVEKIMKKL